MSFDSKISNFKVKASEELDQPILKKQKKTEDIKTESSALVVFSHSNSPRKKRPLESTQIIRTLSETTFTLKNNELECLPLLNLPEEIFSLIFNFAAISDPNTIHSILVLSKKINEIALPILAELTNLNLISWDLGQFCNYTKEYGYLINNFNGNDFNISDEKFIKTLNQCQKISSLALCRISLNAFCSSIVEKKDLKKLSLERVDDISIMDLNSIASSLYQLKTIELRNCWLDDNVKALDVLIEISKFSQITEIFIGNCDFTTFNLENLTNLGNSSKSVNVRLLDCKFNPFVRLFLNTNFNTNIEFSKVNKNLEAPRKTVNPNRHIYNNLNFIKQINWDDAVDSDSDLDSTDLDSDLDLDFEI